MSAKRIFSTVILLAMTILFLQLQEGLVFSQSRAILTAGVAGGNLGDKGIVMPLSLTAAPEGVITTIQFDLYYENSSLKVTKVTLGDAGKEVGGGGEDKVIEYSFLTEPITNEKFLRVVIYGADWGIRDGVITNVEFEILSEGTAGKKELKLTGYLASDKDAKSVPLSVTNGEEVFEKPNELSIADSQAITTEEDKAVVIILTGVNPEGDTLKEKALREITVIVKPVKRFLMWRSYKLEVDKDTEMGFLSWELGEKQKLPFMLTLDKNKGTIYGLVWGKGEFELILSLITEDNQVIGVPCKLKVD